MNVTTSDQMTIYYNVTPFSSFTKYFRYTSSPSFKFLIAIIQYLQIDMIDAGLKSCLEVEYTLTAGKLKFLLFLLLFSCLMYGCSQISENLPNTSAASAKDIDEREDSPEKENHLNHTYFNSIISEINKETVNVTPEMKLLLDSIQTNEIQSKSQFSLLQHIKSLKLTNIDTETASKVASILYELVLNSNVIVMERNISTTFNDNIFLGLEAKVNFDKKQDFSFYNPNDQSIKFAWEPTDNGLKARLLGPKLKEHYKISFEDEQSYPPKVIKQFSPILKNGEVQTKEKGNDGKSVTVMKETIDIEGNLLNKEIITKDFYLPVHRIEIHSFIKVDSNKGTKEKSDKAEIKEKLHSKDEKDEHTQDN
ncbi:VanW family protein [Lederbergia wuyishanensis]|uniref:Lipoprotein n=1 Tax=Lederbergia wuyishanensis TaxID=1347903 RepID=A0ABU0D1U4_9BACI|nr:VanW family protein [Lederbergia wuyishanensis]MCJ8006994.1 VanW family protein [Lederbergia wuyishanensis]MDQ0342378.1 hypothetical protein [Lederbergia wuyishanensis]